MQGPQICYIILLMRYFVIGSDGNRYGPADVATLNGWIREGRLTPQSLLEEEGSGMRLAASGIPSLSFGSSAPVVAGSMIPPAPQVPITPYSAGTTNWSQPPAPIAPGQAAYVPSINTGNARKEAWSSIGFAIGAPLLGLITIYGIFIAIGGIRAGWSAYKKGDSLGLVGLILSILAVPAAFATRFLLRYHFLRSY